MKKAVLAITALFAVVTATPALAAEFSFGGFMRFRYVTGNPGTADYSGNVNVDDDSASFTEYRIRNFFNLKVNDHVTVNTKLEWNSFFGDQGGLNGAAGDLQVGTTSNTFGETELRIKNAFVRFDVPGAPVTLTVGQQDFSTPKAIISVEDYTGVKATIKALGGSHDIFWARLRDDIANNGFQTTVNDADWFGIVPNFKVGDISISPHLSYVRAGQAAVQAAFGGDLAPDTALGSSDAFFLGIDTSGKAGPVGFTADVVYQNGTFATDAGDFDFASYIVDVSGSLAAGPGTLTIKALYSPGDDGTDSDIDLWVNVLSTDLGWSPLFHDGTSISNFAGSAQPGVENGGCICLGAEYAFSPYNGLTVTPNVYYLMAAEDIVTAAGNAEDSYGIEAGVQANWKLWDAVNLLAQFDYLFAGDVFEDAAGNVDDTWRFVIGPNISW